MNALLLLLLFCLTATTIIIKSVASSSTSSSVDIAALRIVFPSSHNENKKNGHASDQGKGFGTTVTATATNPTYASFNIDASYNRGFFHINFTNPNLIAATKSLAPFILRFGGSGNDYLHYDCETIPGRDSDNYGCLNTTHRTNLLDLVSKAGGKFLFGVSFDMSLACDDTIPPSSYVWNASDFTKLIKSMKDLNQTVWAFELGNELNNRGQGGNAQCGGTGPDSGLLPHQQADAINIFSKTINYLYPDPESRPVLIGPDTGYFKPDYWLDNILPDIGPKLHAVTHHVYLGINRNNYNNPSVLDRVLNDTKWYVPMIRKYAPQAEIWAGEDGPTGGGESGACGPDNVSICGLYGSVLWYADDMALRALHGFHQYQRQDLIGGRYSLVGIHHDNQALSATAPVQLHPDFWINILYKRIVGPTVLNVTLLQQQQESPPSSTAPTLLRLYAFMGKPPSKYSVPSNDKSVTFVVINLDNVTTAHYSIDAEVEVTSTTSWMISPESSSSGSSGSSSGGGDGPFGNRARLNGILLPMEISDGKSIDNIPVNGFTRKGNVVSVDPISVAFVRVHINRIEEDRPESEKLIRKTGLLHSKRLD